MPYDKKKRSEVTDVKNSKRWLGILLVVLLVGVALYRYMQAPAQSDVPVSPGQEQSQQADDQQSEQPENTQTEDPSGGDTQQPDDQPGGEEPGGETDTPDDPPALAEDGSYTTRDDVALYLHLYGHLPDNFITKREAEKLGWSGGSLEPYAPGCCIGGDRFGNYEGNLPKADGRTYKECDIDTLGAKSRGAKRIVFSNDGLIYYTEDHYNTFTLLYGEEAG